MDFKDWSTILKAAMLVVTLVFFVWRMRKKYTVHAGAVLLDKANKLMRKGDLNRAVSLYRQAAEHPTPEISRTMICLTAAANLQEAEHNHEALEFAEQARALEPDNALAYRHLGIIHSNLGHMEESLAAYRRSLELNNQEANTWISYAVQFMLRKDYTKAAQELEKGALALPNSGPIQGHLAYAYAHLLDIPRAEMHLKAAKKLGESNPDYALEAISEAKKSIQAINNVLREHGLTLDELKGRLARFMQETSLPSVKITATKGKTAGTDCKFAGQPYQPAGFQWPADHAGQPMKLLAQLNLRQMPRLKPLPSEGLLQFYIPQDITPQQGTNGILEHVDVKVLFHQPPYDDWGASSKAPMISADHLYPISREMKLSFEASNEPMSMHDYRFGETFGRIVGLDLDELPEEIYDQYEESFSGSGHKIGGYPFFTQDDPRCFEEALANHTTMLLQIDSDMDAGIQWGDNGVGSFFITPDALEKLDFSDVFFSWDCY